MELTREDRAYIRHRIDAKISKLESSVERVSVRLEDVNGPRGGVDKVCRAKVTVKGVPVVVVERRHQSARAAVDGTMDATERAVRKILGRRRNAPRRIRSRR